MEFAYELDQDSWIRVNKRELDLLGERKMYLTSLIAERTNDSFS
jgi:hypothetical protein